MCPVSLCARASPEASIQGGLAFLSHIMLQGLEPVQQGGISLPRWFVGILSSGAAGMMQFSRAARLVRRVISAYLLVVSKLAWPSHARITFTSTPASRRRTAVVWRH